MNPRGLRRYIDDLLAGRRPAAFRPDDFEAAQIRTAIDLQAAKPGAGAPRPEFLADLHRQLADQLDDASPKASAWRRTASWAISVRPAPSIIVAVPKKNSSTKGCDRPIASKICAPQ